MIYFVLDLLVPRIDLPPLEHILMSDFVNAALLYPARRARLTILLDNPDCIGHLEGMSQAETNLPPSVAFVWNRHYSAQPTNLGATLASGQNFRWQQTADGIWWGTIEQTAVALWQAERQPDSPLYWQTFPTRDHWEPVRDYLRLDVDVLALYARWTEADPALAEAITAFRGLRILRQPPQECFFAFLCASCNTVLKIERSVKHLAAHYGVSIETGLPDAPFPFHAFPTLDALANADESVLRAGLWGYRAPRVIALARFLESQPDDWLLYLRSVSYAEAHAALSGLFGIGAKLADCICLFSLDKDAAVPVDTHVRQIATRRFRPDLAGKSLTPRVYQAIADAYRSRYGAYAGWAQQLLFFNELRRAS